MRTKSVHLWKKTFFAPLLGASLFFPGCETPASRHNTSNNQVEIQHLEQLLDDGESFLKNEEYEKAIASYKEILKKNPHNIQALNNSGYALKAQGKFQDALKYFDQALVLDPKKTSTLNNKAQVLYELGKKEEAQEYFDQAIENADDSVLRAEIMRNKTRALGKEGLSQEEAQINNQPHQLKIIDLKHLIFFPSQVKPSSSLESLILNLTSSLTEEEKSYFPLTEGNAWSYIRTINSNHILSLRLRTVEDEGKIKHYVIPQFSHTNQTYREPIPKISEEKYTVITKAKNGFWKVKVEGSNPRDKRYDEARNKENENTFYIWWGYHDIGLLEMSEGRTKQSHDNETKILDTFDKTWINILRCDALSYLLPGKHKNKEYNLLQTGAIKHKYQVTVPAGTFTECLKCIFMVSAETDLADCLLKNVEPTYFIPSSFSICFATESYFAKGVGLVKEVQYNDKGEETYRLELKSYNVK